MSWVLDSTIVVEALRGNRRVLERIETLEPDDAILTAPVLAELLVGAPKTTDVAANLQRVEALAATMRFEPFGRPTAKWYGE